MGSSSRRNTELLLLLAASLPVALLFALVTTQAEGTFLWTYLTVPASLFGMFAIAHLSLRKLAPGADPVLLPIAFILVGFGLAFITRLVPEKAMNQIIWLVIAMIAMIGVLVVVPSLERVGQFKYLLMLAGLALMIAPALIGSEINGSKLWIRLGPLSIQPGEIARVCIILFLAAYLAENREMLSISTRKVLGIPLPEMRTLAPLVFMWAISFMVLIAEKDLGSSLLFFGIFLVMVYAATGRFSYVLIGLVLFSAGATTAYSMFTHVQTRVSIWLDPFGDAAGKGYQLVQSLFAFAAGGLLGVGPGRGLPHRIPFVDTDFVFSAIGEELGFLGAAAIVMCFLVIVFRGLSTATRAKSDMAALTAVGLVASIGLQVFVIVGGVTRLIPLTGITLPFVSRGGSSMLSTFIILALLLRAGDEGTGFENEMKSTGGTHSVLGRVALSQRLTSLSAFFILLMVLLIGNLTWLQIIQAQTLRNHPANSRNLALEAKNFRGKIITRDNVVLAESVKQKNRTYKRAYPQGNFAAHTLGYYSLKFGRSGIEQAANDALTGQRTFSSWADVVDSATGKPIKGDNVILTLDATVQRAAEHALAGRKGAVVVLDPKTGGVLASVSNPGYNPATIDEQWYKLEANTEAPLLDRSRQTLLAPGSTFKVVTLTGAYSHDVAKPTDTFPAPGTLDIGNAPVTNFEKSSYSAVDLQTATAKSINTVFGQLAVKLGPENLVAQANQFGFGRAIPYELKIKPSLMPDPTEMTTWETAWAGIGQPVGEHESPAGPQATVFQMALVASAIANDGTLMKPHAIDRIESADGSLSALGTFQPRRWLTVCSKETANLTTDAMKQVVATGSGARARISNVAVAGKTGTAEVGQDQPTNAWFIAFAPADNPTVALAILIEGGGLGGRIAAPTAKPIIEAALKAQQNR